MPSNRPIVRSSLRALSDMGLIVAEIGHYFSFDPVAVKRSLIT